MQYKIVFVTSNYTDINSGSGGHLRSIKEIAKVLSVNNHVSVVTYGDFFPSFYSGYELHTHISVNTREVKSIEKILLKDGLLANAINAEKSSQLVFVAVASLVVYMICVKTSEQFGGVSVLLKPGGPPWRHNWRFRGIPVILFTKKDYDNFSWFDQHRPIFLLTERVNAFPVDDAYIDEVGRSFAVTDKLKILTICRVHHEKKTPLEIIYRYIARYVSDAAHLHVGFVQDEKLGARLHSISIGCYSHFQDLRFTENAAKAIYWCDVFCGIGRSVIEAMSCGKPVFVPVFSRGGEAMLVAVTNANWTIFANHNFTSRTPCQELETAGDIIELRNVSDDSAMLKRLGRDSAIIYNNNYNPTILGSRIENFLDEVFNYSMPFLSRYMLDLMYKVKRAFGL